MGSDKLPSQQAASADAAASGGHHVAAAAGAGPPAPPQKKSSGLRSFAVPSAVEELDREEADAAVDAEIHRDEDVSIKVTQSPGFLCHIEATAAFRMPARTLFKQVITHPDNAAIFRHMDRCAYRRVLEDDGRGHRRVRVAHEASWRFLLFHGTFTTKLLVEEDDRELVMNFQLDPQGEAGGVMRKFHGRWKIRPHPADPQHASLSTLDQDLALGVYMPPPFDRILKRISCNQVRKIFEDVKREADNVNRGKPTLRPWEEVHDKAFGDEDVELRADGGSGVTAMPAAAELAAAAAAAAVAVTVTVTAPPATEPAVAVTAPPATEPALPEAELPAQSEPAGTALAAQQASASSA